MNRTKIASIEITNRKIYINAVLSFLDSLAATSKTMDYSRYNRLRYVAAEMLKHRIERAYPGAEGVITAEFFVTENYFEFSVRDKGVPSWTDVSVDKEKKDSNGNESLRDTLLNYMTDGFGMEKLGKHGQRIFVRLDTKHQIVFKKPEPYPETKVLDTNISIKAVKTYEDAIEAIRCIYSEYGYSYGYEKLYYIDSFMKSIENKEIMSFLAVNEHGQTAGHFALAFSDTFKNMPEISTVVTRKEFRGLGLFAKFMDHCMKLGEELGLRALMGQPVAFHPLSQKAFIKSEFTATAMLLSYIASDMESEYNKNKQRLDLFTSVKILDKNASSTVYAPDEICEFLKKIYKNADYNCEFKSEHHLDENTVMNVETSPSLKSAKMIIKSASDDLENLLVDAIKDSVRSSVEMIELLISLNTPGCEYAYKTAKKHHFVFAGAIPGSQTADYIVMQHLIGADCNYDRVVTVGEFEELKNDIISIGKGESNER